MVVLAFVGHNSRHLHFMEQLEHFSTTPVKLIRGYSGVETTSSNPSGPPGRPANDHDMLCL